MRACLILASLIACEPVVLPEPIPVRPGAPIAGAAEGTIDLPVGTPMGGFSARTIYLGGNGKPDNRDSAYSTGFVESAGIQTRPKVKTLWLENGDIHLVIIKVDLIYSFDELVAEVARQLEDRTGEELEGRVVITANHSHNAYGPFSDQLHFYLGGDKYNEEIFQRLTLEIVDVAEEAYQTRQEASLGTSWTKNWDPDNRVYRDRREDNNELVVWEDDPNANGKDPWLHMLRVDTISGEPIAVVPTFGIHGTLMGESSPMLSSDAPGHIETLLEESFPPGTVVMHMQGGAGDASPAGNDDGYARLESVGEQATAALYEAWSNIETSSEPISLETASRHIWQTHDQIRVQREKQGDLYYTPIAESTWGDGEIYDENGAILTPIDEFIAPYGAAFCGSETPLIAAGNIGSDVYPYSTCMDVELVSAILEGIFVLPVDSVPLPLTESMKAGTTAALIGPLPTRQPDGTVTQEDLLVGFFPGEPTAMFTEQWRRRVQNELGFARPLLVGYAQDHEGYLMIPEDWLLGGYEPNINLWGPLQAEHIMEGVLRYSGELLGNGSHDDEDPISYFTPTEYEDKPLPTIKPDPTPDAGQWLSEVPEGTYLPRGMQPNLAPPESLRRAQDLIQIAWIGGDPMVDLPQVSLERLVDDVWTPVTSRSGRPITDAMHDILLTHTPAPLYPVDVEQTHTWWATWQPVGHVFERASLPLGTYRMVVDGQHWVGSESTWPWTTEDYRLESEPFELLPAELSISSTETGVEAWIQAPERGFRMIHPSGRSNGANPLIGPLTVEWGVDSTTLDSLEIEAPESAQHKTPIDVDYSSATWIRVTDAAGNQGTLDL
jgi:neutral ceramidase